MEETEDPHDYEGDDVDNVYSHVYNENDQQPDFDEDLMALMKETEEQEEDDIETLFMAGATVAGEKHLLTGIEGLVGITLSDGTKEFMELEDPSQSDDGFIWIPAKRIKLHVFLNGELSEFFPVYDKIKNYPEFSVLMGVDSKRETGEEYFLCTTIEARNQLMNPTKMKKEFVDVQKQQEDMWNEMASIKPRKWRSLGSESEVRAENYYDSRPRITMYAKKLLTNFPDRYNIKENDEKDPNFYASFFPEDALEPHIIVAEMDKSVQVMPQKTSTASQTGFSFKRNKMNQHEAQTLPEEEVNKQMESEEIGAFIKKFMKPLEKVLQQNEMVNLITDDYANLVIKKNAAEFNADAVVKEEPTFSELRDSKGHIVTRMTFHPFLDEIAMPKSLSSKTYFLTLADMDGIMFGLYVPKDSVKPDQIDLKPLPQLKGREEHLLSHWIKYDVEFVSDGLGITFLDPTEASRFTEEERKEMLQKVYDAYKESRILKTDLERTQEEMKDEARLKEEYKEFLAFQDVLAAKLLAEAPPLPTAQRDIQEEFDDMIRQAENIETGLEHVLEETSLRSIQEQMAIAEENEFLDGEVTSYVYEMKELEELEKLQKEDD